MVEGGIMANKLEKNNIWTYNGQLFSCFSFQVKIQVVILSNTSRKKWERMFF